MISSRLSARPRARRSSVAGCLRLRSMELDDLLARLGQAEGAHEQRRRLLALAVDAHGQDVALVGLELEPRAAARDDLRVEQHLVGRLVALGGEVDARGANELGDDDALRAVDDERAARRHEREVAHKDVLLLDLAGLAVDEADLHEQRCLVGDVLLLALVHRVLRLAELVLAELHAHVLGVVLDGADILERLRQALALEKLKAVRLDGDEVGDVHDVRDLSEASPIPIKAGLISRFSLSHEAFPPSCAPAFLRKSRNCLRYVGSQGESRKIFTNCGNSLLIRGFNWGRWKRTGFGFAAQFGAHENAPAGPGRSCVSGSLLSSGHAVARDGHANRLEVSIFCVLRTIQALSSVIGDERTREAGHRPRSTMSCTADDALLASWAFAKRKNCLECGDSRVRRQLASR